MPPRRGESVERTDEYEEFIKKVGEYHEKRGTNFDPEPKVGVRHIDLLKLYNRVVGEGGYDLVSDTRAKPLMWRKIAEEFIGKNQYTPAQAFQIKNVFYKNLCAYEISTHWGKEPPPKEILEDVTAKGGNVMARTLDNFTRPLHREERNLDNGDTSDTSPEQKTPKEEKMDDDPGSATGRSTRGLRHQPPQRVLFQPDLTSARQTRGQGGTSHGSPAPGAPSTNGMLNTTSLSNGASSTLASYEPSQSYPLSLKPVITPANNPEFYRNERKRKLESAAGPLAKKYKNIMLPGTGFIGPNIYVRAQLALQSGLPEEEQYALHHLVKISHERGDKYRFDQFSGLAEALVKKALQVSSLFYDVEWDISYDDDYMMGDEETLNGLHGTSDIIQRLRSKIPLVTNDTMQDVEFLSQVNRITEAGLIIRNMCMLDANAQYLSMQPMTRDYLAIVLDLPQHSHVVEMQHYALETAEQVLKYCDLGPHDALYHSLLSQLERDDRGAITIALRTISRIAMHLPPPKRLTNISDETLQKVQNWLMVEDEELRSASLDFLMQYTSFADNVDNLLQALDGSALVRQLSRLLLFAAKEHKESRPPARQAEKENEPLPPVPRLSRSIVESLLKLDEPERSSEWLRMCFIPDPACEMTQISLWQAYQATFSAFHATHPHLIAGDFIKNVSNTFAGATAQVAGANKYVIRGIRARKVPVEGGLTGRLQDKGRELHKCCWRVIHTEHGPRDPLTGLLPAPTKREGQCGEWFRDGEGLLRHILGVHLEVPRKLKDTASKDVADEDKMDIDSKIPSRPPSASLNGGNGALPNGTSASGANSILENFDFKAADTTDHACKWANCTRTTGEFASESTSKVPRMYLLARHIQTHLPSAPSSSSTASTIAKTKHNIKPPSGDSYWARAGLEPPTTNDATYFTTLQDEKNDAAGLPLGAALVLRNIAKFIPRIRGRSRSKSAVPDVVEGMREVLGAGPEDKMEMREGEGGADAEGKEDKVMMRLFDEEVRGRLFYAMAFNRTLKEYLASVLGAVGAGAGAARGGVVR